MTVKDITYQDASLSAQQGQAIGIKTFQEWTTGKRDGEKEGEDLRGIYEQAKDNL